MSDLLPKLEYSHLGSPSKEKLALDKLGGFSKRTVEFADYENKKFKFFGIKYHGFGDKDLVIKYKERSGSVEVVEIKFVDKVHE